MKSLYSLFYRNSRSLVAFAKGTFLVLFFFTSLQCDLHAQKNLRDYGVKIGVLPAGPLNSITDVQGVSVGHKTLIREDSVRTGVTAILPHDGNIFQQKVPAAVYVGNGFGKLAGSTQVKELGNIETPVILTNTLSVPVAAEAVIGYTLELPGNENVRSVNPVVGETNDGYLNDIRGRHVSKQDVLDAIASAGTGSVPQGNVGAGTGTRTFGFKGGIGTSSRALPESLGGYTVGVLVQTNFGGVLQVAGVPVGEELGQYSYKDQITEAVDGSCMIVVATDAPMTSRNLERLAKRAMLGLARTGGFASNGSGDYVVAFSTAETVRTPYRSDSGMESINELRNEAVSPLFLAVVEATEEAIINSLFHADTMSGRDNNTVESLPVDQVLSILKKYNRPVSGQ